MNVVCFDGNIVREPELRIFEGGTEVCNLCVAVNDYSGGKEHTHYIDVCAWGKTGANTKEFTKKGDRVLVTGRLQQDRWKNKDGQSRSRIKVVAAKIDFLGSRKRSTRKDVKSEENEYAQHQPQDLEDPGSDTPF